MTACRSAPATATVETFREVEVELFDADEALDRCGHGPAARRRRAVSPDSTPKYVRALRRSGHQIPETDI